jgi:putative ABC transport system permease protein
MAVDEKIEQGMSRQQALRAVRLEHGDLDVTREVVCSSGWESFIETFWQDLRFGLRTLRKNPGFVAVAVLTLALGIGANTAIFSVVNAVLLSPLPYEDASRLVLVKEVLPRVGSESVPVSGPDIEWIRKLNHVFEKVGGFREWTYELSGKAEPERVTADRASSDLFEVLGVHPTLGRTFTRDEERPGNQVAILSYGAWQRRFGGDHNVLGETINLDRRPYTIIGVMPKTFVFPLPGMSQGPSADIWVPLALTEEELKDVGDNFDFSVVAKLKSGVALKQANADLGLVAQGILEVYSRWASNAHVSLGGIQLGVEAQPLVEGVTGRVKPLLLMLLGAVGFVLLIACVNVANLLLIRTGGRHREMAVRMAMGAGGFRLLRQLLIEGMLLALAGGSVGVGVAVLVKRALVAGMPAEIPMFRRIELDAPVLLFTLLLATVTGLIFGAVPAFLAWRTDVNSSLKEGGRTSSESLEHQRLRGIFVIVEVALSLTLLVGAGLLVRSFLGVLNTDPGFHPEHVLTASVDLPPAEYPYQQAVAFYEQLMRRSSETPGTVAVGGSTDLPLLGDWTHLFTPEGYTPPPGAGQNLCYHSVIYGNYLQAVGIPLLRGRYFTEHDRPPSTPVLIVSEALAKDYWPGQDPIGKRLKWGPPGSQDPWLTVVGIVGDVKQGPLDAPVVPHTYEPYAQLGDGISLSIALRGRGDPLTLVANLRSVVHGLDPQLALGSVRTMEQVATQSTAGRRFNVFLLGSFAGLALLLSAIGIYGVLGYFVTERTHEIGVRMALGARRGHVVTLVLGRGMRVMAFGVVLGLAGAIGLTQLLRGLLYEVRPTDPLTYAAVLLLLSSVGFVAGFLPACRATRVDPVVALRYE